jgi:hypothetical protein
MCNCNSPWAQNAQQLLAQNANDASWHTVNFLYQNHCGLANGTTIDAILTHLAANGLVLSREVFQQTVFGALKEMGIVASLPYPGGRNGVYIPCSDADVRELAIQMLNRVHSELTNLDGTTAATNFGHHIVALITQVENTIQNI